LLLASVQKLFDQYQLAAAPAGLMPEPEPLTRDDLELVCWMLVD
jgi:hypothetical protein